MSRDRAYRAGEELLRIAIRDVERQQVRILYAMNLFLGGILAVIIVLLALVTRNISKPLGRLYQASEIVASGNLDHKIGMAPHDEIGQLARAFDLMTSRLKEVTASREDLNREIAERKELAAEREKMIEELRSALSEIKILRDILPICSYCKKIRNDEGYYEQLEGYLLKFSGVGFSHTICPHCLVQHFPEEYSANPKDETDTP
jgi:HAMP domain-containing protein